MKADKLHTNRKYIRSFGLQRIKKIHQLSTGSYKTQYINNFLQRSSV